MRRKRDVQPDDWSPPSSLYELLGELGAEEVDFGHDRVGRKMRCNRVATELFCIANGKMRCRHGNSEAALRAARRGVRKPRAPCDCVLKLSGTMMRSYFSSTGAARGGWPTVGDEVARARDSMSARAAAAAGGCTVRSTGTCEACPPCAPMTETAN
jgi:hypothetical protein